MTPTLDERFARYHAMHPETYRAFVRYAFELRGTGVAHGSPAALIGRIRWETAIAGKPMAIDNSYASRYAQLAMDQHPELAGFFRLRMWPSRHPRGRRRHGRATNTPRSDPA